ncbi:hypothetical protein ABKV19_022245 [Rosa sericea]
MGGIGKTTLADAVFHGLSSQFEAHCFLANVRERSGTKGANFSPELYLLRDELLRRLLGDRDLTIHTRTIGAVDKERLRRTKVLVVLDDVNDSSQLTFLAGEVPFGPGSRIIITTRDMQPVKETLLLKKVADHDVKIYKVEELNGDESLQLFHSNAATHSTENSEILEQVADHAAGVPLALKILSSLFLQCESKEEQELLWKKLKKFPDDDLQNVYRVSFDGLKGNEKEIFLDIACFHKKEKLCDAKRMLAACGLFPDIGIKILTDMSLISIKENCIWMHDVIQEMGWEIVREECTEEPGKRSRLHNGEDVCHVLKRNIGTAKVQSISSRNCVNTLMLDPQAFTGMHNLRFLMLRFIHLDDKANLEYLPDALQYLFWHSYPLKSFPSKFSPDNLVELHMPWSKLKRLWKKGQNPKKLKRIDLSYSMDLADVGELSNSVNIESINLQGCRSLVQVPDLSKCVYIKGINLLGCVNLVQVPSYFRKFTRLTHLNLGGCSEISVLPELQSKMEFLDLSETAIEELPPSIWSLEKLLTLNLRYCTFIKKFSSSPWKMKSLYHLLLSGTNIETVPSSSFMCMTGIISLELRDCPRLVSLPTDICKLKSLERLDLYGCSSFTNFPEIAEPMENLQYLNLSRTKIEELPSSVGKLVGLKTLDLSYCRSLELLPNSFYNLNLLESFSLSWCVKLKKLPLSFILCSLINLNLGGCKLLEEIPDCFTSFPELLVLDLSHSMIETIPPSIKQVSKLKYLSLYGCERLQSLPVLPFLLEELFAEGCKRLETVSVSVTAQTQGLDQILSGKRTEFLVFPGCDNLDENSRSNIMDDAHFRIMRMATALVSLKRLSSGEVELMCPGNEIPKWFSCQTEGFLMSIKLPLHWSDDSNFLGIALCSVSAIHGIPHSPEYKCGMILKTNTGETHTVNLQSRRSWWTDDTAEKDHVFVWYNKVPAISDEAKWSTEASFHFYAEVRGKRWNGVKRCGVCFLYAQGQDDDALKFEVTRPQEVTSLLKLGAATAALRMKLEEVKCGDATAPFRKLVRMELERMELVEVKCRDTAAALGMNLAKIKSGNTAVALGMKLVEVKCLVTLILEVKLIALTLADLFTHLTEIFGPKKKLDV